MKINFHNKLKLDRLLPKIGKGVSSPGIIKYIGKIRSEDVKINVLNYNQTDLNESSVSKIHDTLSFNNNNSVSWINISGVHKESIIQEIGETYNIHKLVLEDITNTTQRPKIEEYDDYLFIVIKMIYFSKETNEVVVEQVSIIMGKNYIITLQEKEGDVFDGIRERIRDFKGKIRTLGSDYLMYAIIDSIVDQYFHVIEQISENIENLEEELIISSDQILLNKIYSLKKEIVFLKKSIWPLRDVISILQRGDHKLINQYTFVYLRDVYDHTIQVIETVETFRDLTSGMLDLYLSTVSNKMNEIMKVLTMFGAIFIPLTFIAGVYGMNFKYIPELSWKWSYPLFWLIIILNIIIMLILFRKKKGFL